MRKMLWLGCVLALLATGCSLDLDRLRGTPDGGGDVDAALADASMPVDASHDGGEPERDANAGEGPLPLLRAKHDGNWRCGGDG